MLSITKKKDVVTISRTAMKRLQCQDSGLIQTTGLPVAPLETLSLNLSLPPLEKWVKE